MSNLVDAAKNSLKNIVGNISAAVPMSGPAAPLIGLLTYELDNIRKIESGLKIPEVKDPLAKLKFQPKSGDLKGMDNIIPGTVQDDKSLVVYKPEVPKSSPLPVGPRFYGPEPRLESILRKRKHRVKRDLRPPLAIGPPGLVYTFNGMRNNRTTNGDYYRTMVPYQGLVQRRRRRRKRRD